MANAPEQTPTVVVIDDSRVVLEVARTALENAGYRVLTHDRPAGCVALILQEKPDLVLMDVKMPTLQGDTIVSILGSAQPTGETVVLLHSSLSAEELDARAKQAGAHGYIRKTSNSLSFVRQVNHWLHRGSSSSSELRAVRMELAISAPPVSSGAPKPSNVALSASAGPVSSVLSRTSAPASVQVNSQLPVSMPIDSSGPLVRQSGTLCLDPPVVLLVDDDMLTLSAHRRLLQSDAFSIEFALSGAQALKRILSSAPPQVVICDVLMPSISGAELYQQAVDANPGFQDRFIFVTGAREERSVMGFLARFSGRVLFKPVQEGELCAAVRRCLARAPLRRVGIG